MSNICALLIIGLIFTVPILSIILVIRYILKRSCKKLGIAVVCCIGAILPLTILGALTDPATWCDHEYATIEEITPTCTEKGKIVRKCSLCEKETIENLDMIPHIWGNETTVVATCTKQGYTKRTCTICSVEDVNYIDKLPHQWEVIQSVNATCTEKGKIVRKCSLCLSEDVTYTDKIAHSWKTDSVVSATCTSEGYTIEKCLGCSTTQRTSPTGKVSHNMKEISRTEPTVDSEGTIVFKCDWCTHEETQTLDKLPPPTYIVGVEYDEIYREYKANKLRAEDTYQGNRYRITAKINGMSTSGILNATGGATLTMVILVGNTYVFFYAEFDKEQEEALKTINIGDTITFEGECVSYEMWTNCELIK